MHRLCVVYQVVDMLVYFEPAALCDVQSTGILLGPLPASKQLWEADNEIAWKKALEGGASTQFGLATSGDLVKLDEDGDRCYKNPALLSQTATERITTRSTVDWEEWCKGMDGFGGLILLTASLTT